MKLLSSAVEIYVTTDILGMLHAFKKRNQFDITPSTSVESLDSVRFRRILDKNDRNVVNVSLFC
ncbi:unnamed protein product [Onchocerca flexuosa]|uniref:Uncharacterized protein n=1 Tax=Onchocerca flexuosa TaxID=387005 RepID=A0A183I8P4_9BILA|nr:unnamed protein product [Onchocerca flexuosa]